jgi:hypothetical protein
VEEKVGIRYDVHIYRGPVVNGVELDQPHCGGVHQADSGRIQAGGGEDERATPPPPPDQAEELLKEWPELETFGVDWVKKWLDFRDRLVEIASVLRRFPWMVNMIRQRPMNILHPYMIEVYIAKDGSETGLSLNPPNAFCAQNGAVKKTKLELVFSRYETYEDKMREVYRPKGLLTYATAAREYVRIL